MSVKLEDVSAGYGRIIVLRGITFEVADGEILGVLGRNGMGKTTLIRCLSGLIPAAAGRVFLHGADITALGPHTRAQEGVTTVVQGRGMFPNLTVRESLEMGRIASGRAKRNRMEEVLEYFPRLRERLSQSSGTLSGGEQQMLAIGRGLMTDPKVILLDEPSDGIMPVLVEQIAEVLKEINRREGLTIVIVEQNVPLVFSMTDRCILLEKGQIVASGSREEISRSEVMKEYLAI
ncbi:MAG: ABC transporter ATP-binding protein [Gammaproteobacteria bacterium]|nr:ABC transporter ATP-binding protein [Gammaproteobacteria bacterium]NIR84112.1 ABC transporter ATP-binding protein [Gammaproteobacteria bacterium]NIR89410.1 ABC transporter ATP-binding protein [Gammaproteobacteria bacterium]NIU07131.1 ABC transporter ATP-binding protein [Gammaproteobacteria bacterium]NIV74635.1 ATP-binding cassette domain-containing protein [Gammaproteobacteria bacterium]